MTPLRYETTFTSSGLKARGNVRKRAGREDLPVRTAIIARVITPWRGRASCRTTIGPRRRHVWVVVVARRRATEIIRLIIWTAGWRIIVIARPRRWWRSATPIGIPLIVVTAGRRRALTVMGSSWAVTARRPTTVIIVVARIAAHRRTRTVRVAHRALIDRLNLIIIIKPSSLWRDPGRGSYILRAGHTSPFEFAAIELFDGGL